MRSLVVPHDATGLELEPLLNAARADALVARRIEELGLPTYPVDGAEAYVAVHEDAVGAAKVVFVMNPTAETHLVKVAIEGASALIDLLGGPALLETRVTRGRSRSPCRREACGCSLRIPWRLPGRRHVHQVRGEDAVEHGDMKVELSIEELAVSALAHPCRFGVESPAAEERRLSRHSRA